MKKYFITLSIIAWFYVVFIIMPLVFAYVGPIDGFVSDVEKMKENRERLIDNWSPLTGLWLIPEKE